MPDALQIRLARWPLLGTSLDRTAETLILDMDIFGISLRSMPTFLFPHIDEIFTLAFKAIMR